MEEEDFMYGHFLPKSDWVRRKTILSLGRDKRDLNNINNTFIFYVKQIVNWTFCVCVCM